MRVVVEQHSSAIAVWAPVASAAIAALAALASWRSVLQARTIWRVEGLPDLQPALRLVGGCWELSVENAGKGLAKRAAYAVVSGEYFADGVVGDRGFLRAGEGAFVATSLRGTLPLDSAAIPEGAVFCEDVRGNQHAWSLDGEHTVDSQRLRNVRSFLRRLVGRPNPRARRAVLSSFYADAAERIEEATTVDSGARPPNAPQ